MTTQSIPPSTALVRGLTPSFIGSDGQEYYTFEHALKYRSVQLEGIKEAITERTMTLAQGLADLQYIGGCVDAYVPLAQWTLKHWDQIEAGNKSVQQPDISEKGVQDIALPEDLQSQFIAIKSKVEEVSKLLSSLQIEENERHQKRTADQVPGSQALILDPQGDLAAQLSPSFSSSIALPHEIPLTNPQYHPLERRLQWNSAEVDKRLDRERGRAESQMKGKKTNDHWCLFPVKGMRGVEFSELANQWDGTSPDMATISYPDPNGPPRESPIQTEELLVLESGTKVGISSCQGGRSSMEDHHLVASGTVQLANGKSEPYELFAVFDGHNGAASAQFAKDHLERHFRESICSMNPEGLNRPGVRNALKAALALLDEEMKSTLVWLPSLIYSSESSRKIQNILKPARMNEFSQWYNELPKHVIKSEESLTKLIDGFSKSKGWNLTNIQCSRIASYCLDRSGTTAVVCVRIGGSIWVANVGDSRACLKNGERVIQLSCDAKPTYSSDKDLRFNFARSVQKRGGVTRQGRVLDSASRETLAVARALNDKGFIADDRNKTYVISPRPKVLCVDLKELDLTKPIHLVLACDGLWDCAGTEEVASVLDPKQQPTVLAGKLVRAGLTSTDVGGNSLPYSTDNVTTMVVEIPPSF